MKRGFVLLLCASIGFMATAQTDNREKLIDECQRLYSDGEYATALSLLEDLDTKGLDNSKKQEVELLKALNTFENDALEGRALIMQYLADYPESAKDELLNSYIALSYYYNGNYEQACKWFRKSDLKRLTPKQRARAELYHALSLIESGNEGAAENLLLNLSLTSKEYATDAIFHLAVINYNREELDDAYKGFKQIQHEPKYFYDVPYYLAGIFMKQGDFEKAKRTSVAFIKDNGAMPQGVKMRQMLGAAEFALGNYEKAAEALALYINNCRTHQRIAYYQLGVSLLTIGEYNEALYMLGVSMDGDDAIAQSSLYHIGLAHLHNNDYSKARMAFEQAANMRHDEKVREEALYNYALCVNKTNYSPFGENVRKFEQFLNDYPKSRHADEINKFLVDEYINSNQYDAVLESIKKIKNPSPEILDAKLKIIFRKGVQKFLDGNLDEAIKYMEETEVLAVKNKNNKIKGEAQFWRAEALFLQGDMANARSLYGNAYSTDEENNRKAVYGIGYTHFNEGNYDEARNEFERFITLSENDGYEYVSDAYNRIADCFFYQREFDKAEGYYGKAANTHKNNADYALYRMAQIQGLKNNQLESMNTLSTLLTNFPESPYTEQAMYEMGRAHIKQEQYYEAIETYDKLIATFPESETSRRATAEKAMIYNIVGDNESAIAAYKEIIELYPHSDEAQVAMQDLKSIYVDMGRVDLFAEYASQGQAVQKIESSEIDTLAYNAAEKVYTRGKLNEAKKAFDDYLEQYPNGAFRLNSYYYKGLISYNQKKYSDALQNLKKVLEYPNNKYSEEAMVLAAEIYFNSKDYTNATDLYRKIASQSKNEARRKKAQTNLLTAAIEQGNHNDVIKYAQNIEKSPGSSPEQKRKAMFSRAKAYLALNMIDEAIETLDILAEDTRTKEGAEAKYLVAQTLFNEKSYDFCEDEINNFIEISTPHTYWMARSFILLADLYIVQGNTMEAKQYLVSLQNNYEGDDDIAEMIKERLSKLSTDNKE